MHLPNFLKAVCLVFIAAFASGCSSQPGVSGTVKIAGEPLAAGRIQFVAQGAGGEFSTNVHDGAFDLKRNIIAGDYKVIVQVSFATSEGAAGFYANLEAKGPKEASKTKPVTHEASESLTDGSNVIHLEFLKDLEGAEAAPSS